jgi:membrane-bound lytic murein transglycosylase D
LVHIPLCRKLKPNGESKAMGTDLTSGKDASKPDRAVVAKVLTGAGPPGEFRFTDSFIIGRTKACGLQIKDSSISRNHLKVSFDGGRWWLKDLDSGNGTFLNGQCITEMPLPDSAIIELGPNGPRLQLVLGQQEKPTTVPQVQIPDLSNQTHVTAYIPNAQPKVLSTISKPALHSETQIMQHYFAEAESEDAGEQTMFFRRAFKRAHKNKSKKYLYAIAISLLLIVMAVSVIFFQRQKLLQLRTSAESIFYVMKSLELQIGKLEEVVLLSANPGQMSELLSKRDKVKGMEQEYDKFLKDLDFYAGVSPEDRAIMRVARTFGECEVNMPKGFFTEVKKYITLWKSSDRLPNALDRARQKGYPQLIERIFKGNNLPPQFFFLALQESNFDERAVGPATRYGNAKGMWQFISQTAQDFGMHLGPLYDLPVYDPQDDRFDSVKSTIAATKYIKGLNNTQAQSSGLLVMASYNWGEGNVVRIIDQMPPNPRERNFWRLLSMKNIPKETYDYVFSIFSAAVICEDPKLFGFDCRCPVFVKEMPSK